MNHDLLWVRVDQGPNLLCISLFQLTILEGAFSGGHSRTAREHISLPQSRLFVLRPMSRWQGFKKTFEPQVSTCVVPRLDPANVRAP